MKAALRSISFLIAIFVSTHSIGQYTWKWGRGMMPQPHRVTEAWAIASDRFGHIYGAGLTESDTVIFGIDTFLNDTHFLCFLVKYDTLGNVIWAKRHNTAVEGITSMTTDNVGNLYIAGSFNSCTYILGSDTLINPGCTGLYSDAVSNFVAKLDSSGNPIWAKQLVSGNWYPSIALDKSGNVILTGQYGGRSTSFGGFPMVNRDTSGRSIDLYLAKLDNSGNVLWLKTAGGPDRSRTGAMGNDYSNAVATDTFGNIFITGQFNSHVFYIDTMTINNPYYSLYASKIFTAKYSASGALLWVRCPTMLFSPGVTSSGGGSSMSLATDYWGNCYITGGFASEKLRFDSIYLNNYNEDRSDIFLTKYDPNGAVIWANQYGAFLDDVGDYIMIDSLSQNVWLSGGVISDSVSFDTFSVRGSPDVRYYAKLDSAGHINFCTSTTGGGDDWACLAGDGRGNIYVCGDFEGPQMIVGSDTLRGGDESFFMAKLGLPSALIELNKNEIKGLANSSLIIYPNPAKETITIKYDHSAAGALTITNMAGQIVHTQAFTGLSTISTAHYVPGIYMCRVVVEGQVMVSRFRVE